MSETIEKMMKGAQWERCKGELQALVSMQGNHFDIAPPGQPLTDQQKRYRALKARVEEFIERVEDDALQE